jgi:hypothetical protein
MNKVGLDTHPELINFRNNEKRKIYNGHYSYPYGDRTHDIRVISTTLFFFLSLLQFIHHVITYHSHILYFSYIYIVTVYIIFFFNVFFRIYIKSKIETLYHTHFIHHFIWIWIMSIVYFPFFIVPKIN